MKTAIARAVASGFGIGFLPRAPGTWASLLAAMAAAALLALGHHALLWAAFLAAVGGVWAIAAAGGGSTDPGWVVIDEIAGQWLALAPLARPGFWPIAFGFALFRLFDIWKPGPVGWCDRRHDALGVMGDDIVAGIVAAALLWLGLKGGGWR
jgi:phosphatidylglycerophosphatase A